MKTRVYMAMAAAALALQVLAAPARAGDLAAGEEMYRSECARCHGRAGRGMASFPRISGNAPEYLTERLTQYRAGEKVGPNSALMFPIAADLSDEDIANLSAFVSTTFQ